MHIKTINMYCWLDRAELNSIWVFYRCSRERACRSGVTVLPPEITPLRHTTPRTLHRALLHHSTHQSTTGNIRERAPLCCLASVLDKSRVQSLQYCSQLPICISSVLMRSEKQLTQFVCTWGLGCWTWIVQQLGHCLSL